MRKPNHEISFMSFDWVFLSVHALIAIANHPGQREACHESGGSRCQMSYKMKLFNRHFLPDSRIRLTSNFKWEKVIVSELADLGSHCNVLVGILIARPLILFEKTMFERYSYRYQLHTAYSGTSKWELFLQLVL